MVLIISSSFNTISGLLDRTWVAGVTPGEFSLAHFIVSLGVNFIQVIVTLACMIYVFQVGGLAGRGARPFDRAFDMTPRSTGILKSKNSFSTALS